MAYGKIVADQIQHSSEGTVGTQYVVSGSAKAWSGFNGSTLSQFDSFNTASITDVTTGTQSSNFVNSFSTADFCMTASCNGSNVANFGSTEVQNGVTVTSGAMTTRAFRTDTNALADLPRVYQSAHGDLA